MVAGTDPRRPEDYDRDFEALVSGLGMKGSETESPRAEGTPEEFESEGERDWFRMDEAIERATPDPEPEPGEAEYKPPPLPPLSRPSLLVAAGWLCFSYCVATVLLTIVGVSLPAWMGYLAVFAFVAAIAILIWRLPKNSDPRDDNGAVV